MKFTRLSAVVLAALLIPAAAFGQAKPISNDQNITVLEAIAYGSLHGVAIPVDDTHGLPVRCISGCSAGGAAGDASASNQMSQIAAANLTNTRIGDVTSPAIGSTNQRLAQINTTLGTPVQAGGTLSNVVQAVATDRGAIVGTSAVQLMAANPARRGLSVQVQSTSASCYVNGTTSATADYHSLLIGPASYYEPDHHVGTGALSIICTAASTSVYAREW